MTTHIRKDPWFKLWGNLTVNPISALTGATTDHFLDDDLVRGCVSAVMLEAKAIGETPGLFTLFLPITQATHYFVATIFIAIAGW